MFRLICSVEGLHLLDKRTDYLARSMGFSSGQSGLFQFVVHSCKEMLYLKREDDHSRYTITREGFVSAGKFHNEYCDNDSFAESKAMIRQAIPIWESNFP